MKSAGVLEATKRSRTLGIGIVDDIESRKAAMLESLKHDEEMQRMLAEYFRADYAATLNQSHDFLQLANLVRGYAESLLHAKHPDLTPEDAAERCPEEGAIYFATQLMRMKMDSLTYLNEINRAHGNEALFSLHPFVLKYVRIYNWQAKQKNLNLRLVNECRARVWYNSDAVAAVLQGLLDNAVKYAPASSDIAIVFDVTEAEVLLTFESLGPRIEDDERSQIFMSRYRGRAARTFESQGQGIGLAAVKQVSDALGLDAGVHQDAEPDPRFPGHYKTRFHLRFTADT